MVHEPETGTLVPFNFDHILVQVPELKRFAFKIETISFTPLIDSSDVTPLIWTRLATLIEEKYEFYDGFVILHGTDTMAFTASALSFMIHNLDKPVILTGSQLPIGMLRTDGKENLITSIEIAAARSEGKSLVPEVSVYFGNKLYRGNRTTKFSTDHFNAFDSPNFPPLATAGIEIKYSTESINYPTVRRDIEVSYNISDDVAILKIFPGITRKVVRALLSAPDLKAVILESFGAGNAPTNSWFLNEITEFCSHGGIIINITQCFSGSTNPDLYETGRSLSKAGVINGNDMTTEAALTKLMYLLGNYSDKNEIVRLLKKPIRGEITL